MTTRQHATTHDERTLVTSHDPPPLAETLARGVGAGRVDQVAFLVEDLGSAVRRWSALYRDQPWRVHTYDPSTVEDLTYRGGPGTFGMRLALIGSSPQIELIEPLAGPSIYHDWIERHGHGMHHLGFFVPSVADAAAEMEAGGHPVVQSGSGYGLDGDGGFAYFDLEETYGTHLELIEVPARRRPSEEVPLPRARTTDQPSPTDDPRGTHDDR